MGKYYLCHPLIKDYVTMSLKGLYSALVTPILNEAIEFGDFKNLIKRQADGRIDGIIVAGTTRESPVLAQEEFIALV
jgi:4-hydroxy-tetrahydrodipicolinate synthase